MYKFYKNDIKTIDRIPVEYLNRSSLSLYKSETEIKSVGRIN